MNAEIMERMKAAVRDRAALATATMNRANRVLFGSGKEARQLFARMEDLAARQMDEAEYEKPEDYLANVRPLMAALGLVPIRAAFRPFRVWFWTEDGTGRRWELVWSVSTREHRLKLDKSYWKKQVGQIREKFRLEDVGRRTFRCAGCGEVRVAPVDIPANQLCDMCAGGTEVWSGRRGDSAPEPGKEEAR